MEDQDFILGELKSSVEHMKSDVAEIKRDVKSLSKSKWKSTGMMAAILVFFEATVTYLRLK